MPVCVFVITYTYYAFVVWVCVDTWVDCVSLDTASKMTIIIIESFSATRFYTFLASGETEQVLRNLPSRAPVSCIAFHPHDHMFATVSYGAHEQVLLFRHV